MKHVSERFMQLPEEEITKLLEIAVEDEHIISLGPGEPDFAMQKELVNYIKKIAGKSNHYSTPQGLRELRESIVKKLKKDNKIKCDIDNIIVANGSQEAFYLALASVADATEEVIIPSPGFMSYRPAIEILNSVPIEVQLKEENSFELNVEDLKKLVNKKTKAVIINSPSNPTGNVLTRKTLEELADFAVQNDLYIISDEAYEKIIYDRKHVSFASLSGMEKYAITMQTFSKTYAMCGFRLGYCVAPKNIIEAMTKMHTFTSISAPSISQLLGVKALSLGNTYAGKMTKEYKKRRNYIVKRLNNIGLQTPLPDGAFYTFSNIQDFSNDSRKFSHELIKKAKVAVVPGIDFGSYGEGYVRCSYATDLKLIKKAMDRMESFLNKL